MRPSPLYLAPFMLLACEPTGSPTGPVSPPTGNALSITIEELQPSCSGTMATDVNSAAMVGGFGCSGSGPQYWDASGNSVALPLLAGYIDGRTHSVNEAGAFAGHLTNSTGGWDLARWLPGPTGYTAEILGPAPAGGSLIDVDGGMDDLGNVLAVGPSGILVWSPGTGWAPIQVPAGATDCSPVGMSGNGAILGSCGFSTGGRRAVYWSGAAAPPEILPMLPGGTGFFVDGLNNLGTVVGGMGVTQSGQKGKTSSITVAVRWDKVGGTWQVTSLPTLGGNSRAFDVDEEGNIVGWSFPPKGSKKAPVLWTGGTIVNLGSLSSSGEGLAVTISPTGHVIAGWSVFGNTSNGSVGGNRATRWRF